MRWPLTDVFGLLCEHFVQLLNPQVLTLRRGLLHSCKSYRNKAVAQSTLRGGLREMILGETGYPLALSGPDSWKMCCSQPKVSTTCLLPLLVLIKPVAFATVVCPLATSLV